MITDLPTKRIKRYHSDTVFTYKMAAKSTGIDIGQNYVTVTLCTLCLNKTRHQTLAHNFPKC